MNRPIPPHGTEARYKGTRQGRPGCRCAACVRGSRNANIRRAQRRSALGSNLVDAAVLLEHINKLKAAGLTQCAIARQAGVSASTVSYVVLGRTQAVHRPKAERILAVQPTAVDPLSDRSALGATRRIRALYAIGHGQTSIAANSPLALATVSEIANGRYRQISPRIDDQVRAAYRQLAQTPGRSHKAKWRAAQEGWPGPLAWDDIDNPTEQPDVDDEPAAPELCRDELAVVIASEVAHLASFGTSAHEIARRVGRSEKYIRGQLAGHRAPGWRQQLEEAA